MNARSLAAGRADRRHPVVDARDGGVGLVEVAEGLDVAVDLELGLAASGERVARGRVARVVGSE